MTITHSSGGSSPLYTSIVRVITTIIIIHEQKEWATND